MQGKLDVGFVLIGGINFMFKNILKPCHSGLLLPTSDEFDACNEIIG